MMFETTCNKNPSCVINVRDYIKLVSGCIMVVTEVGWTDRWWLSPDRRRKELVLKGVVLSREGVFSRGATCYGDAYKRHATTAEIVVFKLTVGGA